MLIPLPLVGTKPPHVVVYAAVVYAMVALISVVLALFVCGGQ